MKKMSVINERLFSGILDRDIKDTVRKEDEYNKHTNIKDLKKCFKVGGVYWANDNLEIEGETNISLEEFNEIPEKILNGWRLPTFSEMKCLFEKTFKRQRTYDCIEIFFNDELREDEKICIYTNEGVYFQECDGKNGLRAKDHYHIFTFSVNNNMRMHGLYKMVVILVRED